jgi:hypothetical protein
LSKVVSWRLTFMLCSASFVISVFCAAIRFDGVYCTRRRNLLALLNLREAPSSASFSFSS